MFSCLLAPMHSKEKQLVLRAIEHLGPSVTPDGISLETGIPVLSAVRQLNAVAAETGAHLEVNANGAISYRFSQGFAGAYTLNIGKQLFQSKGLFVLRALKVIVRMAVNLIIASSKIVLGLLWILIRISFAVLLVASIILAICAMIAAIFGDSGGGGDGLDLGSGGDLGGVFDFNFDFGHAFGDFVHCFDFTYWDWNCCHGHYHYYDPGYGGSWSGVSQVPNRYDNNGTSSTREAPQADFLTDVFSFLFGDGDPNGDLDQRRYRFIGSVIQRNNGAVIAEQLAPYATGNTDNEDWMLPILVHFNGVPEVSESGTIVYLFPSFVISSNSQTRNSPLAARNTPQNEVGDQVRDLYRMHLNRQSGRTSQQSTTVPSYLQERPWLFSLASDGSIWCIFLLTLANLGASWWLYDASMHTKILLNLHGISVFMLGFAIFMLAMPALRWAGISMLNLRVHSRNARRQELSSIIANPDEALQEKLHEACGLAKILSQASTSEIIYSTERDALEQEFESLSKSDSIKRGNGSSLRR